MSTYSVKLTAIRRGVSDGFHRCMQLKFAPLLLLLLASAPTAAQNIGLDVQRIIANIPEAIESSEAKDNQALGEIIATLAYYGGMPDADRVRELMVGAELLKHYQDNEAIQIFLAEEGLDNLIAAYSPPDSLPSLQAFFGDKRGAFLKKTAWEDLFKDSGELDLEKLKTVYSSEKAAAFDLADAANNAQAGNLPSKDLVGNALAGLSDWISNRAQEELTYSFLTKFREDLEKNKLNYLFPNTVDFLPDLNLLNYKAILPSIRKSFIKDLNTITFNLGRYLEAQDPNTFRSPEVYNVFMLYRMLDLGMRKVELPDILAYTYGDLGRARLEVEKEVDLALATRVTTQPVAYQTLMEAFDRYVAASNRFRSNYRPVVTAFSNGGFNPLLTKVQADTTLTRPQKLLFKEKADSLQALLGKASATLSERAQKNPNTVVGALLKGQQPYAFYNANPSVGRFDQLFGPEAEAMDTTRLRAAGLTALREILAADNTQKVNDLVTILEESRQAYLGLNEALTSQLLINADLLLPLKNRKDTLVMEIAMENSYAPHPALVMLQAMVDEVLINTTVLIDTTVLTDTTIQIDTTVLINNAAATGNKLSLLRNRFETWVVNNREEDSPYTQKMAAAAARPLSESLEATINKVKVARDSLLSAEQQLRQVLNDYNEPPVIVTDPTYNSLEDSLLRTYHNLATFESLFGMAREVFFLLSDSTDTNIFLTNKDMSVFSINGNARQLLAGLGQERMAQIPALGQVNPAAVSSLLVNFSYLLSENRALQATGEEVSEADRRIGYVTFITSTIKELLEAAVFQRKDDDGNPVDFSLVDKFPAFAKVPEVNEQLGELFALSQKGEFRFAVDNLLNLARLFEIAPTVKDKKKRLDASKDKTAAMMQKLLMQEEAAMQRRGLVPARVSNEAIAQTIGKQDYSVSDIAQFSNQEKLRVLSIRLREIEQKIASFDARKTARFRENLFKYGGAMADVAAANRPADIEAAINSIALPVGSSQIKRSRNWSLELGAYFGSTVGRETLELPDGVDVPALEEETWTAALWVPVGLTLSKNIGGKKSLTLFASLLDLGAVTAFRIGERNAGREGGSVAQLPEFTLENVAAPGLHLMYNFPKSPFTLGFGRQSGPGIRKFSVTGVEEQLEASATRWMATFSVDVPIFRLGGD